MDKTLNPFHQETDGQVLPLAFYGHPVLEKQATAITAVDERIVRLAADMIATMYNAGGIGLAAPQVGFQIRLIVIDLGETERLPEHAGSPAEQLLYQAMPLVLVNPEITAFSETVASCEEGCLSLPEIIAPVTRPSSVTFQAEFLDGSRITSECRGLLARCLQHEIDHLNGITFNRRLDRRATSEIDEKLKQLRRKTRKQMKRPT